MTQITYVQVENLVAIELSYINTKHPDFEEARLIYRGLTDDVSESNDLRKLSMQNAVMAVGPGKQVTVLYLRFCDLFLFNNCK